MHIPNNIRFRLDHVVASSGAVDVVVEQLILWKMEEDAILDGDSTLALGSGQSAPFPPAFRSTLAQGDVLALCEEVAHVLVSHIRVVNAGNGEKDLGIVNKVSLVSVEEFQVGSRVDGARISSQTDFVSIVIVSVNFLIRETGN